MLLNFWLKSHIYSDLRSPLGLKQWRYLSFSLEFILLFFLRNTHNFIKKKGKCILLFFHISKIFASLNFQDIFKRPIILKFSLLHDLVIQTLLFLFFFWKQKAFLQKHFICCLHFMTNKSLLLYTQEPHRPRLRSLTRKLTRKGTRLEKERCQWMLGMRKKKDSHRNDTKSGIRARNLRLLLTKDGFRLPDIFLIDLSLRGELCMERFNLQPGTCLFAFKTIIGGVELGAQNLNFETLWLGSETTRGPGRICGWEGSWSGMSRANDGWRRIGRSGREERWTRRKAHQWKWLCRRQGGCGDKGTATTSKARMGRESDYRAMKGINFGELINFFRFRVFLSLEGLT